PALDHGVAGLAEVVLQRAAVGEAVDHHLTGLTLAFPALDLTGKRVVVDAVLRHQLVDGGDVPADERLLGEPPHDVDVLLVGHVRSSLPFGCYKERTGEPMHCTSGEPLKSSRTTPQQFCG